MRARACGQSYLLGLFVGLIGKAQHEEDERQPAPAADSGINADQADGVERRILQRQ